VTQLERTFNDVRQTSTPVLREVGTDAVNEINELKAMLEQQIRRYTNPTMQSDHIRFPSAVRRVNRYPIPAYSGDRKTL